MSSIRTKRGAGASREPENPKRRSTLRNSPGEKRKTDSLSDSLEEGEISPDSEEPISNSSKKRKESASSERELLALRQVIVEKEKELQQLRRESQEGTELREETCNTSRESAVDKMNRLMSIDTKNIQSWSAQLGKHANAISVSERNRTIDGPVFAEIEELINNCNRSATIQGKAVVEKLDKISHESLLKVLREEYMAQEETPAISVEQGLNDFATNFAFELNKAFPHGISTNYNSKAELHGAFKKLNPFLQRKDEVDALLERNPEYELGWIKRAKEALGLFVSKYSRLNMREILLYLEKENPLTLEDFREKIKDYIGLLQAAYILLTRAHGISGTRKGVLSVTMPDTEPRKERHSADGQPQAAKAAWEKRIPAAAEKQSSKEEFKRLQSLRRETLSQS